MSVFHTFTDQCTVRNELLLSHLAFEEAGIQSMYEAQLEPGFESRHADWILYKTLGEEWGWETKQLAKERH